MGAPRFVEVPAPLDERVGQTLLARVRDAVGLGLAVGSRLNDTVHDVDLQERTTSAIVDALRPGTLPSTLLLLLLALLLAQAVLVDRSARRILREHGHFLREDAAGDNGTAKAHGD